MIQIKIKDKNGYGYEQYHTEKDVCKRIDQLREKGIEVDDPKIVTITNFK